LNQYFRLGMNTAFDLSCAYEFMNLGSPATAAHIQKLRASAAEA
jgi:hypothetical protein